MSLLGDGEPARIPRIRRRDPTATHGRYQQQYSKLNSSLNSHLLGPRALAAWKVGQLEANVSLLGSECHWGTWKHHKAVILHFYTQFRGLHELELSSLTTEVSFHGHGHEHEHEHEHELGDSSIPSVFILRQPAPRMVFPKGLQKHEEQTCWRYFSSLKGVAGSMCTTAIWDWENGSENRRLNGLHGGVLIHHEGDPFDIHCTIEGRLTGILAGAWGTARRILRFFSGPALDVKPFPLHPHEHQEGGDLQDLVAGLQRKMEDLIHGADDNLEAPRTIRLNPYSTPAYTEESSTKVHAPMYPSTTAAPFLPLPNTGDGFYIAIICALPKEFVAVRLIFDSIIKGPNIEAADTNHYIFGTIANHRVVATCLPSNTIGNSAAANAATHLKRSFCTVECCLLVGIGGGIPSVAHDIRLGDVVVSDAGIIKHDFEIVRDDKNSIQLNYPTKAHRSFLTSISTLPDLNAEPLQDLLLKIAATRRNYGYPESAEDVLFQTGSRHIEKEDNIGSCLNCLGRRVLRDQRLSTEPKVHYGIVASGDKLMKNAYTRDLMGRKHNALCIEMEGSGIVASDLPCLSIRGICDYADSHKNDAWQEYACATAAAYARYLLTHTRPFGVRAPQDT